MLWDIMASSIPPIECCICLNEYNETDRRPRALPCAHNICTSCLQDCLNAGRDRCSICRKAYRQKRIEEFPINTDLEKLIQLNSKMQSNGNKENMEVQLQISQL